MNNLKDFVVSQTYRVPYYRNDWKPENFTCTRSGESKEHGWMVVLENDHKTLVSGEKSELMGRMFVDPNYPLVLPPGALEVGITDIEEAGDVQ